MGGSNLTPQVLNYDLSTVSGYATSAAGCYAEVLQHAGAGPRPMIIFRHGGAGTVLHRRDIWTASGGFNSFATYMNGSSLSGWDICSLGTPQFVESSSGGPAHLSGTPMVHCPDGVTYETSPKNIDYYAAAVRATIDISNPSAVVLAGGSWGNILGLPEMMRAAMPVEVVGYIGFQPIPDLRAVDWERRSQFLSWKAHQGTFGTTTAAAYDAISYANREALSFNWYLEQANVANYRPCFFLWERVGNHIMPYGDNVRPGSSPHDSHQYISMLAMMRALGLTFQHHVFSRAGEWDDNAVGIPVSQAIETFIEGLL